MPKLTVAVEHSLTPDEAVSRLQGFLAVIKERYQDKISNLQEEWETHSGSFSFSVMGFSTSGTVSVEASEVRIDGKLPLAAMMFKGMVEQQISEQLTRILKS